MAQIAEGPEEIEALAHLRDVVRARCAEQPAALRSGALLHALAILLGALPAIALKSNRGTIKHRAQADGEEPSARHRPGPWLPVIPVDLVPGVGGGDRWMHNFVDSNIQHVRCND